MTSKIVYTSVSTDTTHRRAVALMAAARPTSPDNKEN